MEQTPMAEVEFELATLHLKGKRFDQAAKAFYELVSATQRSEAWCGLGLSKLGTILDETTPDEIFYCFDKAKAAEPGKVNEIEQLVLQSVLEVAGQLYGLYTNAILAIRDANTRKTIAIIGTVVSTLFTMEAIGKNRAMASIASAGLTALNYNRYLSLHSTAEQLTTLSSRIVKIIEELKAHVQIFVEQEQDNLQTFNNTIAQYEQTVIAETKTESQRAAEQKKQEEKVQQERRIAYVGDKNSELADVSHPFHKAKEEALKCYNKQQYGKAVTLTNQALKIYGDDYELKLLKNNMLARAFRRDAVVSFVLLLFGAGIVGAVLDISKENAKYIVLIPIALSIVFTRYRHKQRSK
ncbi:hypothetical protein [Taibaiella soli]|uniref:Tetratricopeptide repeat protein n=1 Tax=Taibaiella soli TaxID=1649169 RepID=A0A2W2AB11_9BACT|nr:hypothetical protein [Taibaiella soli]PZF72585.1 hypothetical protein DN068_12020 [Taibaiella soli]